MKYIILLLISLLNSMLSIAQLIQSENKDHSSLVPTSSRIASPHEQDNPLIITKAFQNKNQDSFDLQSPSADRLLTSISPNIAETLTFINIETNTLVISPDGKILLLFDPVTIGYKIFNISNPSSPVSVSSVPVNVSSISISSKGFGAAAVFSSDSKTAFVANAYDDDDESFGRLLIIDLSNISLPIIMTNYLISQTGPLALSPDDKTLFLGTTDLGVTIFDVSNLTSPMNISVIDKSPTDMALSANGTRLFLIDSTALYIFDVSNPKSSICLNETALKSPFALCISPDGNTAFVATFQGLGSTLQVFDVSDPTSLKNISSVSLGLMLFIHFVEIVVSPDASNLFITGSSSLIIVNILDILNPISQTVDSLAWIFVITLSPDGRNAFLSNDYQVIITELLFNVQVGKVFALKPNIINPTTSAPTYDYNSMVLSSDTKTAFMFAEDDILTITNVSNLTSPELLSTYNFTGHSCHSIAISPDEKTVFLTCSSIILVLNISNLTSPNLINTFPGKNGYSCKFEISPNGQIGFQPIDIGLGILNMSNLNSPANISTYNIPENFNLDSFVVSKDSQTIFLVLDDFGKEGTARLEIVDVHNPAAPVQVSSTSIIFEAEDKISIYLSPNEDYVVMTFTNIIIFNVLNRTAPTQVIWQEMVINNPQAATFSEDMKILFTATADEILIIDISTITTPRILRSYSVGNIDVLALSPDESTLFCGSLSTPLLTIIDLIPEYTLYMMKNSFVLGETSSSNLLPLQLNSVRQFDLISQNFSFLQVSLYNIISTTDPRITYPALPNWIVFDQTQGAYTFAPHDVSQIGQYQLYTAISTQVPNDAFVNIITNITNETESLDLIASLIWMGYMNPDRFLTNYFIPTNKLFLDSKYAPYASQIQAKLNEYYIEMATSISIESSLSVQFSDQILVTTLSQNTLSVIITSTPATSDQILFAKSNYATLTTISGDQATITMQGSLIDINKALTQLLINIEDSTTSYSGVITVSDGLNPQVNLPISNMSQYFQIFKAPALNSDFSIQSQAEKTPILTGQQFMIDISDMFSDMNGQDLDYSLAMQDSTQQVPEWLMLRGNTITGTPPEQLKQFNLKLIITATNQFKSTSQAFTINIKISALYILRLVITYGGALITAIGLWIYIYTFYNILCKKRYRYPKDFVIRVGDRKSVERICAIAFISEEVNASRIILNRIKLTVAKERKRKSICDKELVKHFIDPESRQLDEDSIIKYIKHELTKIETGDESLPFKGHLRPELVNQLIINDLIMKQLNFKDERMTKKRFNAIKPDWINLVEKINSDSLSFQLNRDKLAKTLQRIRIHSYKVKVNQDSNILGSESLLNTSKRSPVSVLTSNMDRELKSEESFGMNTHYNQLESDTPVPKKSSRETSLINQPRKETTKAKGMSINLDLLEKAVLAHIFAYHHLNADRDDIEVVVNKKVSRGLCLPHSIRRFIKRDLKPIKFVGGGDTLYDIKFSIQEDVLRISGTPEAVLKNKTLVVQIVNRREKILRELWLNCFASTEEQELRKIAK